MSFDEWLNQGSPKVLATALGVAVFAGLGAGTWLKLPDYIGEPVVTGEPQMIQADDPGREKWRQVVGSLGGLGATFIVPAVYDAGPPPRAEFAADLDEQLEATKAEIDAELRQAEERAMAWRMASEAEPRRYSYAEPVRYSEPVRYGEPIVTYAEPVYASRRYEPPADAQPVYAPPRRWERAPAPETYVERPTVDLDEPLPPPPPRPAMGW